MKQTKAPIHRIANGYKQKKTTVRGGVNTSPIQNAPELQAFPKTPPHNTCDKHTAGHMKSVNARDKGQRARERARRFFFFFLVRAAVV